MPVIRNENSIFIASSANMPKGTKIVNEYAAQSSAPVISQPVCARLPAHIPVTDKITIPAMKFSAKRYSP